MNPEYLKIIREEAKKIAHQLREENPELEQILQQTAETLQKKFAEMDDDQREKGMKKIKDLLDRFIKTFDVADTMLVARSRREDGQDHVEGIMQGAPVDIMEMIHYLMDKANFPLDNYIEAVRSGFFSKKFTAQNMEAYEFRADGKDKKTE